MIVLVTRTDIEVIANDFSTTLRLQDLPVSVAEHTAGIINNQLIICGGFQNGPVSNLCWKFDKSFLRWTPFPPMMVARRGSGNIITPNGLYKQEHKMPIRLSKL